MTRVAVVKPDRPGDLVLATPAIRAVAAHHGPENVTVLVASATRRLAGHLFPGVALRTVDPPHLWPDGPATVPLNELGRELDAYDLVLCLRDDPWLESMVASLATRTELADGDDEVHETLAHKAALARRMPGYSRTALFSASPIRWPERVEHVALALEPGGPFREWPLANWLELATLLLDAGIAVSIVAGSAGLVEVEILAEALGTALRAIAAVGDDPARLRDALAGTSLVVACDGDLAHLCSLEKPVATLFGATSWRRRAPFGPDAVVLTNDLACSPCILPGNGEVNGCTTRECLAGIPARSVFTAITSPDRAGTRGLRVVRGASHLRELVPPAAAAGTVRRGKRIFVECTHTDRSEINTGIQRTVRNVLRHAPGAAAESGHEVVPVVFERGRFVPVDASRVIADKHRPGARPGRSGADSCDLFRYTHGESLDLHETHEGNLLLLLDSSWHMDIWPAVRRFKRQGGRVAGVLYDLIPISHPHTCDEALVVAFRTWLDSFCAAADLVVAISRHTADRFEAFAREREQAGWLVPRAPVTHFHLGSELDLVDPDRPPRPAFRSIFAADRHVFLSVGSIEPRKNHGLVLEAFEQYWHGGGTASLLLVGERAWKTEALMERIDRHPARGTRLFLVRDATDGELDFAYRNASALVFASQVEGFGLPVVEAFQRGLPVLCSDIPVFREIADGRAIFFGLDRPDGLARVLADFCATRPPAGRTVRNPSPWPGWAESCAQLVRKVVAALESRSDRPAEPPREMRVPGEPADKGSTRASFRTFLERLRSHRVVDPAQPDPSSPEYLELVVRCKRVSLDRTLSRLSLRNLPRWPLILTIAAARWTDLAMARTLTRALVNERDLRRRSRMATGRPSGSERDPWMLQ